MKGLQSGLQFAGARPSSRESLYSSGRWFEAGHRMRPDPITGKPDTRLTAIAFAEDPQLGIIDTRGGVPAARGDSVRDEPFSPIRCPCHNERHNGLSGEGTAAVTYRLYAEEARSLVGSAAQTVLATGAEVHDLHLKQASLEEVFIYLTGRHLR